MLLVIALAACGCRNTNYVSTAPRPAAVENVILDTVVIEIEGAAGTEAKPARCNRARMQVHVKLEFERWPRGATELEVGLYEHDDDGRILLDKYDITRRGLTQFFEQMRAMLPQSVAPTETMEGRMSLTVSSSVWCDEPCTSGVCTLHSKKGKDSSEGDSVFELDVRVRIYGKRGSQRVILSERWAKKRVNVYCGPCPP